MDWSQDWWSIAIIKISWLKPKAKADKISSQGSLEFYQVTSTKKKKSYPSNEALSIKPANIHGKE